MPIKNRASYGILIGGDNTDKLTFLMTILIKCRIQIPDEQNQSMKELIEYTEVREDDTVSDLIDYLFECGKIKDKNYKVMYDIKRNQNAKNVDKQEIGQEANLDEKAQFKDVDTKQFLKIEKVVSNDDIYLSTKITEKDNDENTKTKPAPKTAAKVVVKRKNNKK